MNTRQQNAEMLIVSKTRAKVSINRAASREMSLDGYGCSRTEQRVVCVGRLKTVDRQSCGCVLLSACCLKGMLLSSSSFAEVEWLRNDLLLGRSRLTEMMMGTMGWVVDGQTGRRSVYVQCRLSGQTLFLRSTGSREWEWSPWCR